MWTHIPKFFRVQKPLTEKPLWSVEKCVGNHWTGWLDEWRGLRRTLYEDCDGTTTSGDSFVDGDDEEDREDGDDAHDDEDDEYEFTRLKCSRAAYLLRIKETHNLTQKALNDIVANTNMLIQDAVETICETVVSKLRETTGEDYSEQISWEVLSDDNEMIANPFQGVETERDQRQKFKELFGFVVSSHCLWNIIIVFLYARFYMRGNLILIEWMPMKIDHNRQSVAQV